MIDLSGIEISDEVKAKIMALSKLEDTAYETQIKNLNKQAKNYADYDDLKQKLGEAEKDKLAHGEQIKKIKKDFALEKQLSSVKVSNEKLVRKLLDTNSLTWDETSGQFTDLAEKVGAICDEYGITKDVTAPIVPTVKTTLTTPSAPIIVKKEGILEVPEMALTLAKKLGAERAKKDQAVLASTEAKKNKSQMAMPRFIQAPVAQTIQAPVAQSEVVVPTKSSKGSKGNSEAE